MGQIGDLLCQPPYSDLLRTPRTPPRCNTRLTSQTPPENGGVAFACARLRLCASSKCRAFTCSAFCGTKLSTCSLISSPRCFYGAFAHLIRILPSQYPKSIFSWGPRRKYFRWGKTSSKYRGLINVNLNHQGPHHKIFNFVMGQIGE